ncbi:hypothetical protein ACQKDA_04030 [Psychrobacter sp. NPDC078370]|uniref:hypothetical protein n=1 Tax=unclassified Psychrobacter TaxID=196806 RepID=UPI003CFC7CB4|tara:strand:- start:1130 stop:2155 length:1026 start_codon:yes stop_codon:yes gene_type:complete
MRLFKKIKQNTSINNEGKSNSNYVLATEYLEELAVKNNQDISSVANYLSTIDPFKGLRNFYLLRDGEFIFLEDKSAYQSVQVRKFLDDATYHKDHNHTLNVHDNFKRTYEDYYLKRTDTENITINQLSLARSKEIPANGSLASYLSFFNIPQIAALYLGIALEDVYITDSSHAYYSNANKYPEEYYKKYMQTVNCIESDFIYEGIVKNNFVSGLNVNDTLDLTQTTIDRNSLERLLSYKGYSLNNLLKNQPSLLKNLEENTLLRENLDSANKQIFSLENEIDRLRTDLEKNNELANSKEGQGDSLLILGAVMECIRDVAKPNYTQKKLIEIILDKYKTELC